MEVGGERGEGGGWRREEERQWDGGAWTTDDPLPSSSPRLYVRKMQELNRPPATPVSAATRGTIVCVGASATSYRLDAMSSAP